MIKYYYFAYPFLPRNTFCFIYIQTAYALTKCFWFTLSFQEIFKNDIILLLIICVFCLQNGLLLLSAQIWLCVGYLNLWSINICGSSCSVRATWSWLWTRFRDGNSYSSALIGFTLDVCWGLIIVLFNPIPLNILRFIAKTMPQLKAKGYWFPIGLSS